MELDFGIVLRSLPALLDGVKITVLAFLIALAIGAPLGALICAARLRETGALAAFGRGYVTIFRTIPEIVLIFWMFYCLPPLLGYSVSGLWAGSVALGLVGGAYLAEVFRSGVQSVPPGQWEAAKALSLSRVTTWTRIIGPQAARLSIPPFINYITELLKGTTLLATIGVAELALKSYVLGAQTFRYLEFLTAIAVLYFIIIFPIARLAERVEHRLAAAMK
jgi:His/Glu/Gln/Arg/opine family amino acid ABC transporter permease subunit